MYKMATVSTHVPEQALPANSRIRWPAIAWFRALLIIAYVPILKSLVIQWSTDDSVGHGFFVPVVAGYIAWQRKDRILQLDWKPAWWGAGVMIWGSIQAYLGSLGAELFLQRSAVLITLVGMLLVFGGIKLIKELAFPLLLLPFMIPLPQVIYNSIS